VARVRRHAWVVPGFGVLSIAAPGRARAVVTWPAFLNALNRPAPQFLAGPSGVITCRSEEVIGAAVRKARNRAESAQGFPPLRYGSLPGADARANDQRDDRAGARRVSKGGWLHAPPRAGQAGHAWRVRRAAGYGGGQESH
jgi:hypothetical protein